MTDPDTKKRAAAEAALGLVENGMRVGLGTGSTASAFVRLLGPKVRAGLRIVGVPTSEATRRLAEAEGIPLIDLADDEQDLDITIDGADEIDPALRLIKGAGGALMREKIVAAASRRMVVIADEGKVVPTLGAFPLPVEVSSFAIGATRAAIARAAEACGSPGPIALRERDGRPFLTDGGNVILDLAAGVIRNPDALAVALDRIPGVLCHGLFIGLAKEAIIGQDNGVRLSFAPGGL